MTQDEHPIESDPRRGGTGFEARDAHVRAVFGFAAGLALLCVLALLASLWIFSRLADQVDRRQRPLHPLATPDAPPPGPHLQAHPSRDHDVFERQQRELLETYGWVDPAAGVVRVPVDHALELVLEEGLPSVALREREDGR